MLPDPSSTSSRPPRPNSIEVKRNYQGAAGQAGHANNNNHDAHGESIYAGRQQQHNPRSPQDGMYRYVVWLHLTDCVLHRLLHNGSPFVTGKLPLPDPLRLCCCACFVLFVLLPRAFLDTFPNLNPCPCFLCRSVLQACCWTLPATTALRRRIPAVPAPALYGGIANADATAATLPTISTTVSSSACRCIG